MFLNRGLRLTGHRLDLIEARVSFVAALKLGAPTITQALDIERVGELQQPVLALRQGPKIGGWRALETLSRFEGC